MTPPTIDAGVAWSRLIASMNLSDQVFSNATFRRLAAPLLDARRRLLDRSPLWESAGRQ